MQQQMYTKMWEGNITETDIKIDITEEVLMIVCVCVCGRARTHLHVSFNGAVKC
jgi:hypothetical protein